MQKKLIFINRYFSPHIGGVERHVYYLSKELLKRGYDVIILTEQHDPKLKLDEEFEGIQIHRLPYTLRQNKLATWRWMWKKRSILPQADIVHIHDIFWWYIPFLFMYLNRRLYITFHGYEGNLPPNRRKILMRKIAEVSCKKNICVGFFMRKWYGTTPDEIIYSAANVKASPPGASNTAVYVGRLADYTGILKYLKLVKHMNGRLRIDVYGDGPLKLTALDYITHHHIPANLHGEIHSVSDVIKSAEYAFVSRYLAILEAMQSKRLVVAFYDSKN